MNEISTSSAAEAWLATFGDALERGDVDAALALFVDDCYWRDMVAFTWNVITLEGKPAIASMLGSQLGATRPRGWTVTEAKAIGRDTVEAWFRFETAAGSGSGILTLQGNRCRTILTTLQALTGHEERQKATRPMGVRHGADRGRKTWAEARAAEAEDLASGSGPTASSSAVARAGSCWQRG